MEQGPLGLNPELRTPPLPATHVRAGTGHRVLARNYTTDKVGPPTCEFTRYVRPRVATSGGRSHHRRPSRSGWRTRGQSGPPAAPAPSSEPNQHTTRGWDRRTSRRWLGNYEKLASRGCPFV